MDIPDLRISAERGRNSMLHSDLCFRHSGQFYANNARGTSPHLLAFASMLVQMIERRAPGCEPPPLQRVRTLCCKVDGIPPLSSELRSASKPSRNSLYSGKCLALKKERTAPGASPLSVVTEAPTTAQLELLQRSQAARSWSSSARAMRRSLRRRSIRPPSRRRTI